MSNGGNLGKAMTLQKSANPAILNSRRDCSMGRDMAKKAASDYRWEKENTMRINLKIRNDSGLPEAIARMQEDGQSRNAYAIQALTEKLIRDGYLNPENIE